MAILVRWLAKTRLIVPWGQSLPQDPTDGEHHYERHAKEKYRPDSRKHCVRDNRVDDATSPEYPETAADEEAESSNETGEGDEDHRADARTTARSNGLVEIFR